jgi:hypothetical protein
MTGLRTGDEGDRHRALLIRQHGQDPRRDRRADIGNDGVEPAGRDLARCFDLGTAEREADGADAVEERIALEIEPAGREGRCRRRELAQQGNAVSRRQPGRLAHQLDAQACGGCVGGDPGDDGIGQHQPLARRQRLDIEDAPRDPDRPDIALEDRGRHPGGAKAGGAEPERHQGHRGGEPHQAWLPPAKEAEQDSQNGQARPEPERRLLPQAEIDRHAGSERHGRPKQPLVALGREPAAQAQPDPTQSQGRDGQGGPAHVRLP